MERIGASIITLSNGASNSTCRRKSRSLKSNNSRSERAVAFMI